MSQILYFFLIGLGIGAVYALAALGMTLLFNGSGLLNFAQGDFLMVGALSTLELLRAGLPYTAAVVGAALITAAVAAVVGLFFSIPLRKEGYDLDLVMLGTLGVSFVLSNLVATLFGRATSSIPSPLTGLELNIGSLHVPLYYFLLMACSGALYLITTLMYARTDNGLRLRAVALDPEAARYSGLSIGRAVVLVWAIMGIVGGLGGGLIGSIAYVTPYMGMHLTIMGVAGSLIGGLYSLPGAMVGGLVIGVAESFAAGFLPGTCQEMVAPCLILIVLLLRPRGLMAGAKARTV